MPTEEERKRKEYRNGYDPRGPLPGKWDAARAEINSLRSGPSEWGSAAQVERGVNYVKAIPERIASSFVAANESGEQFLNKVRDESMGQAAREKRLQMANYPSEATRLPNIPQAAYEPPNRESESQRLPALPAAVANGTDVSGPREGGSSSESTRIAGSVRGGGVGPTNTPGDLAVQKQLPAEINARNRYLEIAGWDLAKRNAMLDAMPEGQRPIQTIRGNKEGWYNPSLSKEFSGLPQALTGIEGSPTFKSEMNREEEVRDRGAMIDMAAAANKRALAVQGMQDARILKEHDLGLKGGRGTAKGANGEKWATHITADKDGIPTAFMHDEASGKQFQVKIGDANATAGALSGFNMEDSKTRQLGLSMIDGIKDAAIKDSVFANQPKHVQDALKLAIKERIEQEKKK